MHNILSVCLLPALLLLSLTLPEGGAVRRKRSEDVTTDALQTSATHQDHVMMLRMQAELTSLKNKVSRLESSLQRSQNETSRGVAFTARISNDRDRNFRGLPLGYQQTVVFNDVLTNVGNAYNHHTGIFTAPVDGTYAFFLTIMGVIGSGNAEIYLEIVKNGVELDIVYADGGRDLYDQGSTLVTTQLREGDHVWVRQNRGNAVRGNRWTVFTGYLLHAQ